MIFQIELNQQYFLDVDDLYSYINKINLYYAQALDCMIKIAEMILFKMHTKGAHIITYKKQKKAKIWDLTSKTTK